MLTTTKFWLWLTTQVSIDAAWRVLQRFGEPEKAYFADDQDYLSVQGLTEAERQALTDKSTQKVDQILADCQRLHVRILTWQDADYPDRLRSIDLPPMVLYILGRFPQFDGEAVIAMAGTRRASSYGLSMARMFAREITEGGGLVLTGVAPGCDQNAIMGAFDARGSVAVVLPGGVDVPFQNSESSRRLYRDLARYGSLITEYPPGTPNLRQHFRMRNRILSGLSTALLCVEAGQHSGVLQVAAYAREQERTVFVIPARIGDRTAAGTNQLMCEGYALPVLSGQDILVHYTARFPQLLRRCGLEPEPLAPSNPAPPPEEDKKGVDSEKSVDYSDLEKPENLSPAETQILKVLGDQSVTTEELIAQTGLSAADLMASLTLLSLRGYVTPEGGGRFCSKVRLH